MRLIQMYENKEAQNFIHFNCWKCGVEIIQQINNQERIRLRKADFDGKLILLCGKCKLDDEVLQTGSGLTTVTKPRPVTKKGTRKLIKELKQTEKTRNYWARMRNGLHEEIGELKAEIKVLEKKVKRARILKELYDSVLEDVK